MDDFENPYAAPRTIGGKDASSVVRPVRRPGLSRALTVLLVMNVLALIASVFTIIYIDALLPNGLDGGAVPLASVLLIWAVATWMIIAWPIVSLAAAIYTALYDRGTRFWLFKSIVGVLMFLGWLFLCLLGVA
jgi:hypothetical protein